ncbi:MAG: hypothetical protein CMO19_00735 [Thaumarchaeota archaeon]|nr:hypothetical protein [Nitrososphaerota archaeon]|tara:strand:+ start:8629 stop:9057 length:429 start_codon:yes stop_codon:yes gene_type:complete
MSDPFTELIIILRPFNTVLAAGLFIVLLSEFLLFRNNIVRQKIVKQKIEFSKKYDEKFLKLYKTLKVSAFTSGLDQKDSYTIRELVEYLISKNPADTETLHSILSSMEKYAYGGQAIDKTGYSVISKWMSSQKTSSLARARI